MVFPSSQSSPGSFVPSPHVGIGPEALELCALLLLLLLLLGPEVLELCALLLEDALELEVTGPPVLLLVTPGPETFVDDDVEPPWPDPPVGSNTLKSCVHAAKVPVRSEPAARHATVSQVCFIAPS